MKRVKIYVNNHIIWDGVDISATLVTKEQVIAHFTPTKEELEKFDAIGEEIMRKRVRRD